MPVKVGKKSKKDHILMLEEVGSFQNPVSEVTLKLKIVEYKKKGCSGGVTE